MKKLLALIIAAALACALASCTASEEQNTAEPAGDTALDNIGPDAIIVDGEAVMPEAACEPEDEVISPVVSTPAPDGLYAAAESEYSADAELLDAETATGRLKLYYNDAETVSGDFRVEQTIANGQLWYYVWLTVDGADDEIFIMIYDPNDDILVQYEDFRIRDGEVVRGEEDREFAVFLEKAITE